MPFQPGNTEGSKSHSRAKPYRDALRMEIAACEAGQECVAPKGSLRWIARQQLERAGEDTAAVKEIADRIDGKVPQGIIGGDDDDNPVKLLHRIERVIVDPANQDAEGVQPAS